MNVKHPLMKKTYSYSHSAVAPVRELSKVILSLNREINQLQERLNAKASTQVEDQQEEVNRKLQKAYEESRSIQFCS